MVEAGFAPSSRDSGRCDAVKEAASIGLLRSDIRASRSTGVKAQRWHELFRKRCGFVSVWRHGAGEAAMLEDENGLYVSWRLGCGSGRVKCGDEGVCL